MGDYLEFQFTNDCPIYLQLAEQIVNGIITGEYKPGEKLPSVREFAVIASVNPNTAQRALSELEDKGLVDTLRNTGKFVTMDEKIIEQSRVSRAKELAENYFKGMKAIGYSDVKALELLEKCKREEETI